MPELRTAIVEREMPHPPEKIWRALTQPHLMAEWLMTSNFIPLEGQKFTLRNQPRPDVTVVIDCEVLTVEPYRMLSYSWAAYGLDSVVTFTLEPTAAGTLLRMEQAGFRPEQDRAYSGAKAAWKRFIARLERMVAELD